MTGHQEKDHQYNRSDYKHDRRECNYGICDPWEVPLHWTLRFWPSLRGARRREKRA